MKAGMEKKVLENNEVKKKIFFHFFWNKVEKRNRQNTSKDNCKKK